MATFLKQAAAVYPDNADVSRQLILLGDTIGKQVRENKQRERLLSIGNALQTGGLAEGMKAAAGEGLLGEALTMQGMLEKQKSQASDDAWRRERAVQADKQWSASHGLQGAQLKIAQDAAARANKSEQLKMGLLQSILSGQPGGQPAPAQPGLLDVPGAAPQAAPQAASFSDRFAAPAGAPAAAPTAAAPASGLPGIPRDEAALSMLGYGDMAKAVREQRKSTPQAIEADLRARKGAEDRVSKDLAGPEEAIKVENKIRDTFKLGNEAIRLSKHPGLSSAAGPIASQLSTVREKTANFETDLENVTTKTFINVLQNMREMSKTGGAVGSVAVEEMNKLANSQRNLSLRQGPENLRANLRLYAEDMNESMDRIAKAYKTQYGRDLNVEKIAVPKAEGGSSNIESILKKYLPQ